jgi:hypothetical protein
MSKPTAIALPVSHPFERGPKGEVMPRLEPLSPDEAEEAIFHIQARNRARMREILRGNVGDFDRKAEAEKMKVKR